MPYSVSLSCSPSFAAWAAFGLLQLIGWLVVSIGLGAQMRGCRYETDHSSSRCSRFYASEWFAISFQFLVLVFVAASGLCQVVKRARLVLSVFMTLSTAQLMHHAQAHAFGLTAARMMDDFHLYPAAIRACAVGFIFMTIANLVFMVIIGSDVKPDKRTIQAWSLGHMGIVDADGKKNDVEQTSCFTASVKYVPFSGNDIPEVASGPGTIHNRVQFEAPGGDTAD